MSARPSAFLQSISWEIAVVWIPLVNSGAFGSIFQLRNAAWLSCNIFWWFETDSYQLNSALLVTVNYNNPAICQTKPHLNAAIVPSLSYKVYIFDLFDPRRLLPNKCLWGDGPHQEFSGGASSKGAELWGQRHFTSVAPPSHCSAFGTHSGRLSGSTPDLIPGCELYQF